MDGCLSVSRWMVSVSRWMDGRAAEPRRGGVVGDYTNTWPKLAIRPHFLDASYSIDKGGGQWVLRRVDGTNLRPGPYVCERRI